jgi:hypothetical protein
MEQQQQDILFDAPIPGENYTSDTKNYPWHRPPEIDDLDAGIEYSMNALLDDEDMFFQYMAYIDGGMSVVTTTDIFVTMGIANGKWTPDFALLLAGPVSRILEIMAKAYGIKAELGLEAGKNPPTSVFKKAARDGTLLPKDEVREEVEEALDLPPTTGAMSGLGAPASTLISAPEGEQMAMLGYGAEDADPMMDDMINEEVPL